MARRFGLAVVLLVLVAAGSRVGAQERIVFGTNWLPDAERGGFYQAEAAGLYRRAGLEVVIQQGGPQINNPQLLAAGRLDAVMISSALEALNYVQSGVPLVALAAVYQKNPQILLAHRGSGIRTLEDMRGRPIMISSLARNGYWAWLRARYGFTDDQIRPYTFNLVAFLNNPQAIQQGFVTYEPYAVREQGADPVVFLLADHGYLDYAGLIVVRRETLEARRAAVQRFVDASIEGWHGFLYGDAAPGLALIKSRNSQITDALLANSMRVMVDQGLILSGDADTGGIGAMTEARWRGIYEDMSAAGVIPRGDYWRSAFDLSMVNRRVGMPR